MKLVPYLFFDGRCKQAFQHYEKCLGGKITFMMTYGESPTGAETPADWRDKVMHITLTAGDQVLQGSDAQPQHYHKPQGISIALSLSDAAEADRIFAGLAENGNVTMPIQETFWAARFGMLVDQFGIPWMINCEKTAA